MSEPQIGPNKKPTPVAISMSPMFYSRSLDFDIDTTIDIDATALMPEPRPPIICEANDQKRNAFELSKLVSSYRPICCIVIKISPTMMAVSRPIVCNFIPANTQAII